MKQPEAIAIANFRHPAKQAPLIPERWPYQGRLWYASQVGTVECMTTEDCCRQEDNGDHVAGICIVGPIRCVEAVGPFDGSSLVWILG